MTSEEMVSQEDSKQSVADELETKIIQQIEYYFSDINLNRDKFMKELMTKDDGWITFEMLLTFKRLAALSEDKAVIVAALRKSETNLLVISDDETKVRRSPDKPLPEITEEYTKELNERTLHLKGFPLETKLDEIMTFCRQYGIVESVEMRRHMKSKIFKGCIFVVFAAKESAEKLLTADEVKYNGKDLLRENKVKYFLRKKEYAERRGKRGAKNSPKSEQNADENSESKAETVAISNVRYAGGVLKLKDIADGIDYKEIKELFQKYGDVSYVEAVNGQKESFIRFASENGATKALEKAKVAVKAEESADVKKEDSVDMKVEESADVKKEDSVDVKVEDSTVVKEEDSAAVKQETKAAEVIKVLICGKEAVAEVLTGDDEILYWNEFTKNRILSNKRRNDKKYHHGHGGKGKGGGGGWNKNRKRGYQGSRGDSNGKRTRNESD